MARTNRHRHAASRSNRGFTLIETAMSLVIIGVGVVAVVDAQQAFMRSNTWSSQAASGTFLAGEIREMTRHLDRHDPVTGLFLDGPTLVGWGPEIGEVTVQDYDDLDDFDGVEFGALGDFPGPINAYGEVIPQLDADGQVVLDPNTGLPLPMQGWTQRVEVFKVSPFDTAVALPPDHEDPPSGNFEGRTVDRFPLLVTVIVEYQGPYDNAPLEVTRITWIAP
ncbi:MAG: prepilin-type N-terminal cleavage/methylation domain-containing protein [Phycisphaerales bacterium]|nr:prepilin-type N-terminal cleavage/methylation domain-containing protein [Phycisphaerales bacterium]